jgi:hypothetical protein
MKRTIRHRVTGKAYVVEMPRGFARSMSATLDHIEKTEHVQYSQAGFNVEGVDGIMTSAEVKAGGFTPIADVPDKDTISGKTAAAELRQLLNLTAAPTKAPRKHRGTQAPTETAAIETAEA